jgi:hypothetical protein
MNKASAIRAPLSMSVNRCVCDEVGVNVYNVECGALLDTILRVDIDLLQRNKYGD